ncbi:MAG: SEC-C metal-binding domain-containing protein, partial [Actinomycetota bacterium]
NVYKLEVFEVPTNQDMVRVDQQDSIYKSEDAKWKAVTEDIVERSSKGQPCLVGTVDIAKSEKLAGYLERRGISHNVLNAKNHEREAFIVAQAGRIGAVVVATNMAGRGVDILLGGNPEYLARQEMTTRGYDNDAYLLEQMSDEDKAAYLAEYQPILDKMKQQCATEHEEVIDLGGLYVLGTERHESRRIDNQLRGRSGRQGDPGESKFYLSLEDDLMRFFATGMINTVMEKFDIPEDMPIESKLVSRAIERAQSQVESQNYEMRKNVLKYDEVLNKQRSEVYGARKRMLEGEDFSEKAADLVADVVESTMAMHCNRDAHAEDWDWDGLESAIALIHPSKELATFDRVTADYDEVQEKLVAETLRAYGDREQHIGEEQFRELERYVFLSVLNAKWREHLYEMDHLREGIGLRGYGQRDPLIEYTREGFDMFAAMMSSLKEDFVRYMFHAEVKVVEEPSPEAAQSQMTNDPTRSESAFATARQAAGVGKPNQGVAGMGEPARSDKVGRNHPCPCGSGKKYKMCHGRED